MKWVVGCVIGLVLLILACASWVLEQPRILWSFRDRLTMSACADELSDVRTVLREVWQTLPADPAPLLEGTVKPVEPRLVASSSVEASNTEFVSADDLQCRVLAIGPCSSNEGVMILEVLGYDKLVGKDRLLQMLACGDPLYRKSPDFEANCDELTALRARTACGILRKNLRYVVIVRLVDFRKQEFRFFEPTFRTRFYSPGAVTLDAFVVSLSQRRAIAAVRVSAGNSDSLHGNDLMQDLYWNAKRELKKELEAKTGGDLSRL